VGTAEPWSAPHRFDTMSRQEPRSGCPRSRSPRLHRRTSSSAHPLDPDRGADTQIGRRSSTTGEVRSRSSRAATSWLAHLLVACIALAGCNGGTVDRHALTKDAEAVDSLACEGRLLARDVTEGEGTSAFLRIHGGELAQRASNFADALAERPTSAVIEADVRALARRAGRVAGLLETLATAWNDRGGASEVERKLAAEGDCP
jgi:hypothetical protein